MSKAIQFRQNKGFTTKIVDGEAFVISEEKIRHFNASATAIWLILTEPTSTKELIEILSQLYSVQASQIQKDAKATLRLFESYKMIRRV